MSLTIHEFIPSGQDSSRPSGHISDGSEWTLPRPSTRALAALERENGQPRDDPGSLTPLNEPYWQGVGA